jgi:uncharacterized membrane protein YagU involved in acid resistance
MTQANKSASMGSWLKNGAIMGLVAGVIFIVFEMVVAGIMQGTFFGPLRMMSAIALGSGALDPTYSLITAIIVGLIVHLILSAIYGVIFGAIANALPKAHQNRPNLIWIASAFGLLLWLANFYVIAPLFFPWFTNANPIVQLVAHTFFYGTAIGLLLTTQHLTAREIPGDRPVQQGAVRESARSER